MPGKDTKKYMKKYTPFIKYACLLLTLCVTLSGCGSASSSSSPPQSPDVSASSPQSSGGSVAPLDSGSFTLDPGLVESINEIAQKTPVADYTFKTSEGEEVKLSDYRGKVLVINFLSSWCQYCRDELGIFREMEQFYAEQPVQFLFVNILERNASGTEGAIRLIQDAGITFPLVIEADNFAYQLGLGSSVPVTAILDTEGNLRILWPGAFSNEEMLSWFINYTMNYVD